MRTIRLGDLDPQQIDPYPRIRNYILELNDIRKDFKMHISRFDISLTYSLYEFKLWKLPLLRN